MTKRRKTKKNYQSTLMERAKDTVKLGMVTGVGSYAMGSLAKGNPAMQGTAKTVNAGLNLVNVGNLANVGMGLVSDMGKNCKFSKGKRSAGNIVKNML